MQTKVKFTKTEIERLSYPADKAEIYFWDTETPFLGLRIISSRPKTFYQAPLTPKLAKLGTNQQKALDLIQEMISTV